MGIVIGDGAPHLRIKHLVDEACEALGVAANDAKKFLRIIARIAEVVSP